VLLTAIAAVNGLQPNLAAALFALAAFPTIGAFALLPALNADWAAIVLLGLWLTSVTALTAATGGAASVLVAGFPVILAQAFALRRRWLSYAGAAALIAYAAAAAIAARHGAHTGDFGAWPQMMVVAYLAYSTALIAAASGDARTRIEQRLAEVAHELRTPLTHILGFAELIERQVFGPAQEKYIEYAGLIRTSGAHLLDLANDLLDLSRIEAERYPLTLERFDVRDVIEQVVRTSAVSAGAKAIALSSALPQSEVLVMADRRALVRILVNTVGNALKFTPEHGQVTVRAAASNGVLIIDTIDNGPGLSAREKARLGRPYERGEGALGVEGAGLGLSLVRALAALHGGRLSFDDAPGGGAIVRVTLPVLVSE
jgi:cell cycle sensor histidine kinase DivJ